MSLTVRNFDEFRRLQAEFAVPQFQAELFRNALRSNDYKDNRSLNDQALETSDPRKQNRAPPSQTHHGLPTPHRIGRKGFDPNQPRVPAGNPDGGQWTTEFGAETSANTDDEGRILSDVTPDNDWIPGADYASRRAGRWPAAYSAHFPGATYSQLVRLDQAVGRTAIAVSHIHQRDPTWQPSARGWLSGNRIEGYIRLEEERAAEAEAHLLRLRTGIGGNFGPPMDAAPRPPIRPSPAPFDGAAWIRFYRSVVSQNRDLLDFPRPPEWDTVAVGIVNTKVEFGINSDAPGYDAADRAEADKYRDILVKNHPNVMKVANAGWKPNDSLYHAESTILLRAMKKNRGTLAGLRLEVFVDNPPCWSCQKVLPLLGLELGNPTVTYINTRNGERWLLRDGRFAPVGRQK